MTDRLPDGLDLDEFLCFAVYSTSHAFNRVYKPMLDALGLTYPQYLVLVSLWNEDDQTVSGLGSKLFLESNTLTPLLKRLEAQGYIVRARDSADERQVRLRLTPEGKALRAKAKAIPKAIGAAAGLSHDALLELLGDIAALRGRLKAALEGAGEA